MISNQLCVISHSRGRKPFGIIGIFVLLLSFMGTVNVSAEDSYAQNKRLTLELTNITMRDVFNEIEKNSEYIFFYSDEVNVYTKVAVNVNDRTIDEIMNQMLKDTDYAYTVSDRQVFIKPNAKKEVIAETEVVQQQRVANGVVVDSYGDPIIGANIVVKGQTGTGTITDIDGKFSLSVPENAVLIISYIGYKTQEVTVGAAPLQIEMEDDAALVDEVVVVGYGVQKKVNVTGAVSTVSADQLETRVNNNLLTTIQGQVPGVTIISRPGSDPSINIRGRGNLGTSSPLYVIDGAVADATMFSTLDPNSIESMSFLKDAASASIYGARAAFGVVLVKTKSGQAGRARVSYNGYAGIKQATYIPELVDSYTYATLWNEGQRNDNPNATLDYTDAMLEAYRTGSDPNNYPNTNWYDLLLDKTAFVTQHSLNISGGTETLRYSTTVGYMDDSTFVPGEGTKRYNVASNLQMDVNKWLSFRTDIKFIQDDYKYKGADSTDNPDGPVTWEDILATPITFVHKHTDGTWGTRRNGALAPVQDLWRNPVRVLNEGGWGKSTRRNSSYNLGVDIKPIKNLVVTGEMLYKWYDYKRRSYRAGMPLLNDFETKLPIISSGGAQSRMIYLWEENTRLTYNGIANYTFSLNDSHNFNVMVGLSYENYRTQRSRSFRRNFPSNTMEDINGGSSAPGDMHAEGGSNESKMFSYFGRVTYDYLGKYLIEANLRNDASSRFHADHRSATFPSFSAGWRVSEESFMKSVNFISNLKLRASWGQLGNINNVGYYDYLANYQQGENYNFGDNVAGGIIEGRPANATLGWETVTITDIGLDLGLFNNRLNITADYYYKKTEDILLPYNVPLEVGIKDDKDFRPSQNIGSLENKGFELGISYNDNIGDLRYQIGGNMTYNKNKVLELDASNPQIISADERWITQVGHPIGSFHVYRTDGLLTQEDIDNKNYYVFGSYTPRAGDIKYINPENPGESGNGEPLPGAFQVAYGSDVPDFTYALNLNLYYKNFELSMFGQGVTGTSVLFSGDMAQAFFNNTGNPRKFHLDRWTPENPNPGAAYPRMFLQGGDGFDYNKLQSDFWLFDADYFRMKNITFGYTFPGTILNKTSLSSLKLYVSVENAFTIRADKRMKDFDPESPSGRGTNSIGTRVYSFGASISF